MKKQSTVLTIALLAGLMTIPAIVRAEGQPREVAVSIPANTNASVTVSTAFADAITRDVLSSLRLKAVEYTIAGSRTASVALAIKRSSTGVAYKTVTVATNAAASGVSFETNEWDWIKPDPIVITRTGTTNAIEIKLLCEEK